jgi:hypothetical protein
MELYEPQDSIHQIIAPVVTKVSEIDGAPQMRIVVCIAAGTAEWTFSSDLDG